MHALTNIPMPIEHDIGMGDQRVSGMGLQCDQGIFNHAKAIWLVKTAITQ